jgi:hypothetical protein
LGALHLQALYPNYEDDVLLLGIDTDAFEKADYLARWAESRGFYWPLTTLDRDVLVAYNVRTQSTKIGIDRNGVIVLREGYGTNSAGTWVEWLDMLSE